MARIGVYLEELVDGRIGVHDENQVEIKLDYGFDPAAARTRYQIETYVFAPRSLGIDRATYRSDQFYADVQSYIRFKTPSVPLSDLCEPTGGLAKLAAAIPQGSPGWNSPQAAELRRRVQLLGCEVRANTRDAAADLRSRCRVLAGMPGPAPAMRVGDLCTAVDRLCADLEMLLAGLRALRPKFMAARRPVWVRELFEYADEYVSVSIEGQLTSLLEVFGQPSPIHAALEPARVRLAGLITAEQDHRREAGYRTVLDHDASGRAYVYRASALKKFMSSVLFLDVRKRGGGGSIRHGAAGLAAGIAMLFSTLAALFTQRWFSIDSMPFVVALVVAYVFKDRIKEWIKFYLSARFSRHLYDYKSRILGPGGVKLGRCRETLAFVEAHGVDERVFAARHADSTSDIERETKPEVVLRYIKDIAIDGPRVRAMGEGFAELNDIIRFNVASFLARMDDPVRTIARYDRVEGAVKRHACPKNYHLNIVLLFRGPEEALALRRFRVVLDRGGIVGLQDVALPGPAKPAPGTQPDLVAVTAG
jgi:hypothetical protein